MSMIGILLLISLGGIMRLDMLLWVAGGLLLLLLVVSVFIQQRNYKRLSAEYAVLNKVKHRTIEYDLVLKAMRLTVWHVDVQTRTITYDCDYRDTIDIATIAPGSDVETFCNTLLPEYKERISQCIIELIEGRTDHVREQYKFHTEHADRIYWGEMFAIVDKRDASGKAVSIVGTSMLIDKQKEIEQALIEARNQAEESDRLKTAFLANISHEVRTPLNAIVGFSEVLSDTVDERERTQLALLIKQNNARLLRLFDDLVNLSRLEAGSSRVHKTRFSMDDLLKDLEQKYSMLAEEKGLALKIDSHSEVLEPETDRDYLFQIMSHYVENALKFTTKGEVTMGCSLQLGALHAWVHDTGKGIEPEACSEKLFERFVKIDEFEQGAGLGLSICRNLAQSLGGKVGVESELGKGSLFWVEVPYE